MSKTCINGNRCCIKQSQTKKPMNSKLKNIWDLSLEAAKEANSSGPIESSLVFIGSKNGGKSNLVYRLVNRTDEPKATLALEYLFTRKLRPGTSVRDVCNIYELGSGTVFTNLLDTLITRDTILSLSVVLVIDLSQLNEITTTLETLTESLREKIENFLSKGTNSGKFKEKIRSKSRERLGTDHEDSSLIIPFPIPLYVIGSKYDTFQEVLDSESKKLVSVYLRLFAHSIGASLYYSSTKSESNMNRISKVLTDAAFSGHLAMTSAQTQNTESNIPQQGPILDYHKPLSIPFGQDSYQLIGTSSLEVIKGQLISRYPQSSSGIVIPDNPGRDSKFAEHDIDLIRSQRDQELEVFRGRIMDRIDPDD